MKPVSPVIPTSDFDEVVVAEHQDEYQDLPAIRCTDGVIITRWKLTDEEKEVVIKTGDIYLLQWNGNAPITPILLQVETPIFATPSDYKDEVLESDIIK